MNRLQDLLVSRGERSVIAVQPRSDENLAGDDWCLLPGR